MTDIKKTNDYSIFKKHEKNREIDQASLKNIKKSIQTNNLLQFRPILIDEQNRVIDGQHRLQAAKELNLDIYYQIKHSEASIDMILLNANQKIWSLNDYINYYASSGNEEYIKLIEYSKKMQMYPTEIARLLNHLHRIDPRIKKGIFKFPSQEYLEKIESKLHETQIVIDTMKRYVLVRNNFLSAKKMRLGVLTFLNNPNVNFEMFLSKISFKADALHYCSDIFSYVSMFKNIYNWRNSRPLEEPLQSLIAIPKKIDQSSFIDA